MKENELRNKLKNILRNRKALNGRDKLLLTAQIILAAIVVISLCRITGYLADERKSLDFSEELQEVAIPSEEPESLESLSESQETEDAKTTKAPEEVIPTAIDFDTLHEISEDAVAWIYVPNGEINYVIAQAEDNDYYLHRLLDSTEAKAGTLFMDFRNNADCSDWNTVIYGHNMKNDTMFGSLLDYRDPDYYEEHPVMYLYTPGKRYQMELIAAYTTDVNNAIYSIPTTKEGRDEIFDYASRRYSFISHVTVGDDDRLVTLSTCSYAYEDARYVVIGKLVEE